MGGGNYLAISQNKNHAKCRYTESLFFLRERKKTINPRRNEKKYEEMGRNGKIH